MILPATDQTPTAPFADSSEDRWDAVVRRDATADGAFYYSVRTTGVYCRPSCAARRALRANVAFHSNVADAERAGFRPCKRCRPDEAPLLARRAQAIAALCRSIVSASEIPTVDTLAREAGLSRFHFGRIFTSVTGLSPKAYIEAERGRRLRDALPASVSVTDAIYAAGYASSGRAYAAASTRLGMTPGAYRTGGSGTVIRFAAGQCTLGALVVAGSERGICAILLGDEPDTLARDLQDRFPNAQLIGADREFERWVATVVGLVEAPRLGADLPLDVRGTAFQVRVWNALRAIPPGTTASYSQIAALIGAPGAVRAVGRACAANPLALAIPCHRVVRSDGALSGYRWGVERKRALLEREAVE